MADNARWQIIFPRQDYLPSNYIHVASLALRPETPRSCCLYFLAFPFTLLCPPDHISLPEIRRKGWDSRHLIGRETVA